MSRLMRDVSGGTYVVNPGTLSSTKKPALGPAFWFPRAVEVRHQHYLQVRLPPTLSR